jgi:hypothetical protein
VSPRIPDPPADPIVERLGQPGNLPETEDVIALIGYVGLGQDHRRRLYADRELQRWVEVPAILDSQRLDPDDPLSRSVVWVARTTMMQPIFENEHGENDGRLPEVEQVLAGVPFSVWNLIPETRLTAAGLLGMIPYGEDEERGV